MEAGVNTAHVVMHCSEPENIGLQQEPMLRTNLQLKQHKI